MTKSVVGEGRAEHKNRAGFLSLKKRFDWTLKNVAEPENKGFRRLSFETENGRFWS